MCLEHHLVGGYVRYISPHIIIIMVGCFLNDNSFKKLSRCASLLHTAMVNSS